AGALEHLALNDILIGAGEVVGLRNTVRPFDAQHVGFEMRAETEMRHPSGGDAGLIDVAGTELEPRADPKVVVLTAPRTKRLQLDVHGEIAVAAIVAQKVRDSHR